MAELKCGVNNCTYNNDRCCCKGDIMVGGKSAQQEDDTCCDSFKQRSGDSTSNTNYKCYAEHVDIKGCGACDCRETACATFKEK